MRELNKFFKRICEVDNGCLDWTGCIKDDRPIFHCNGKEYTATRFIYEHQNKVTLNRGLWVIQKCGNNKCVNPEHLVVQTMLINKPIPIIEKFYEKVFFASPDGCHYWTDYINPNGYGYVKSGSISQLAHRASYEIHKGRIPDGMVVRHSCDNKLCVNPDHLEIGTHKDNVLDKVRKRRHTFGVKVKHRVRLTDRDAIDIYHSSLMVKELSSMYQISRSVISSIRSGKAWKHIHEKI